MMDQFLVPLPSFRASGNPLQQAPRTFNQKRSTRLRTTCYLFGEEQREEENP
jgi:hypothetical protein